MNEVPRNDLTYAGEAPRVRAFVDFLTQQLGDTPPWERTLVVKPSVKRRIAR
jgi:hypothetical protein